MTRLASATDRLQVQMQPLAVHCLSLLRACSGLCACFQSLALLRLPLALLRLPLSAIAAIPPASVTSAAACFAAPLTAGAAGLAAGLAGLGATEGRWGERLVAPGDLGSLLGALAISAQLELYAHHRPVNRAQGVLQAEHAHVSMKVQ
jgi:hypothetical protein